MPSKIEQNVIAFIRKENLFKRGDSVLLAVSGGADSTALLLLFNNFIVPLFKIKIAVAHLNHSLRGRESDADQRFVEKLCQDLSIECISEKQQILRANGESGEEAARRVRYAFLNKASEKWGATKIATAHHLDDQAETVLFRIMGGTGLKGLSGIAPQNSPYIRPLLEISRKAIEEYLENNGQKWRNDKSNNDLSIPRNRIRHKLLPFLKTEFGAHIPEVLARLADNSRTSPGRLSAAKKVVDALCRGQGFAGEITKKSYDALLKLAASSSGETALGSGYKAIKKGLGISLSKTENTDSENSSYFIKCTPGLYILPDGLSLRIRKEKNRPGLVMPSADSGTAYFDARNFKDTIEIRAAIEGDRFTPLGSSGTKKLSDFFIDSKVPKYKRAQKRVFLTENTVFWVYGMRISDKFKISEKTENLLILETAI
ncbi:MAG: tRNA lysidine(34) synthetase TilS [Fibrobacteres bacterium]|nr:tRNA lysidine(34) synthetase TilS [Fibrobacterota bacterium]